MFKQAVRVCECMRACVCERDRLHNSSGHGNRQIVGRGAGESELGGQMLINKEVPDGSTGLSTRRPILGSWAGLLQQPGGVGGEACVSSPSLPLYECGHPFS